MHWSKYFVNNEKIGLYEQIFENLTIVDAHAHIGKDADGHYLTASKIIERMKSSNISKSIVFPFNHPIYNKDFRRPNEMVYQAYKKYPTKIIPFFRLNPNYNWRDEFDKRVSQGFRGLKLHPRSQDFKINSRKVFPLYKEAEKIRLPLLLHTGFGVDDLGNKLADVLKHFPNLRIIIGHSAFVDLQESISLLREKPNILFEISTIKLFDLYDLLKNIPHKQIIFGSDYPYYDPDFSLEMLIDTAIMLNKSPNQIKDILGRNILRWLV